MAVIDIVIISDIIIGIATIIMALIICLTSLTAERSKAHKATDIKISAFPPGTKCRLLGVKNSFQMVNCLIRPALLCLYARFSDWTQRIWWFIASDREKEARSTMPEPSPVILWLSVVTSSF